MKSTETPLMRQYGQIKQQHPDTILLFRLGDFYETFGTDAELTAKACGITLTKRNNGAAGEIPLAGFPHHQLDAYLPRLVKAGHRVAVCEQLEDPKQAKGIVRRGVVEVVTPGVVMYDKLLEHQRHTFAACLLPPRGSLHAWGLALVDVSTGTFMAGDVPPERLQAVLESYQPAEVLVPRSSAAETTPIVAQLPGPPAITRVEDWHVDVEVAQRTLTQHFETASLKGFGLEGETQGIVAAGVLLQYVLNTQQGAVRQITGVRRLRADEVMILDSATRRNLEIHASMHVGERSGALVEYLDQTKTSMGARLLRWWLQAPLVSMESIQRRLDIVSALVADPDGLEALRSMLAAIADLERLAAKIAAERCTARDLSVLLRSIKVIPPLQELLVSNDHHVLHEYARRLQPHPEIEEVLEQALTEEPPAQFGSGKMFKPGYNADLDRAVEAMTHGKDWLREYQERERERTGIATLKVSMNSVFGYYVEISNAHQSKVPEEYQRRQTLTNAERYVTLELKQLEETIMTAESTVLQMEQRLLADIRNAIAAHCSALQRTAELIATIDCLSSFAHTAIQYRYVRPDLHEGTHLRIVDGRHPVIERVLPIGATYVPNSVELDTTTSQIQIITGPNMSGKSSYLRQVGLIVFMAHVGCFVPAQHAVIPCTDRIFTRVGAQDNVVAGESTFLVEMQETANILHNATERSLILLDEVGRGTATFDGISIAWALASYVHEVIGAKTMFATHYHELAELAQQYSRIHNVQVEVQDDRGRVVFTHRVVPGHSDHSFGIHVAQMAGLPAEVIASAKTILQRLESDATHVRMPATQVHMSWSEAPTHQQRVMDALQQIDVNTMTPIEALTALAELSRLAHE